MSFVVRCRSLILIGHAMTDGVVKQDRDFPCRGRYYLLFADPRREAPVERPQGRITSANCDGGQTQEGNRSA